jgi:hypothetical protein
MSDIAIPPGMLAPQDLAGFAALPPEAQALLVKHGRQLQIDHTRTCQRRADFSGVRLQCCLTTPRAGAVRGLGQAVLSAHRHAIADGAAVPLDRADECFGLAPTGDVT